jgi:hypothetical protein
VFTLATHTKPVIPGHGKAHEITKQQNQIIKKILTAASRANTLRMT